MSLRQRIKRRIDDRVFLNSLRAMSASGHADRRLRRALLDIAKAAEPWQIEMLARSLVQPIAPHDYNPEIHRD